MDGAILVDAGAQYNTSQTWSEMYTGTARNSDANIYKAFNGDPNTKDYEAINCIPYSEWNTVLDSDVVCPDSRKLWGMGGPDYRIGEEFNNVKHNRGILSMARSADPNSGGSQFFIVHADSNFLDEQYTVFGRIVTQENALGTGNAVYDTLDHLLAPIEHVYVSFGTQPLVRTETIEGSLDVHLEKGLRFTLATVVKDNPYAPLVRGTDGSVTGSVETHLDGAEMPARGETNIGAYWASRAALDGVLCGLHEVLFREDLGQYATTSGELGFPN